ncbi:NAD(P)-dependent oxidoreductase [Actinoallomurus acaciae]|uniref:NAD(P)-dependent oxidoreductase n=1 Tax=Actinoallomurus acaciae TaxID=502577 RepID=A0ABV5YME8_9ACTN
MSERVAPVSVIGLGPMGRAVAGAFLDAGHPTTVWNRTASRAEPLVAHGATAAATAADAVADGPLVVACLLDDDAVHAVLDPVPFGSEKTLVNLTSAAPEQARRRAAWARGRGIAYLDGAIMTPTPSIGRPSALVLYSGPEETYRAQGPALASLGGTATYLGEDPGRAAAFDVALLDIFWNSVGGLVHGLALARAEGISGGELAPYAESIFGLLPEMMTRFARQLDDGVHPGERSTIASASAGIEHIIATAETRGIDTGVLTASRSLIRRAEAAGHGADGLSRLASVLAEPAA